MKRRIVLAVGMLALMGVSLLVFCRSPQESRQGHPPTMEAVRPRAVENVEQGNRIVQAIYEFKEREGLWPTSLTELIPEQLSADAIHNWQYEWHLSGRWHLTRFIDFPHWAVRYERHERKVGWQLTDGLRETDLDVHQPRPKPRRVPPEEVLVSFRKRMRQRLQSEPQRMIHYQGQVGWHYKRGQYLEAREVCLRSLQIWPDHWWPNAMLATLDARLGSYKLAVQRLSRYTAEKAEFCHSFLLVQFYHAEGQEDDALATLEAATQLPLRGLKCRMYTVDQPLGLMPDGGAWLAAGMAYRAKRYSVALAVCDRWERYHREESPGADASYHTIRAACSLAVGDFGQAQLQVTAMATVSRSGRHFGDNIEDLAKAIQRRDRSFVYETDSRPFSLFVEYE